MKWILKSLQQKNILFFFCSSTSIYKLHCLECSKDSKHSNDPQIHKDGDALVLHLTDISQQAIEDKFNEIGYHNYKANRTIAISRNASERILFQHEPIFGSRAAFRLQGFYVSKDKDNIIVFGKVSSQIGEIKDVEKSYIPALTLYKSNSHHTKISKLNDTILDLPSNIINKKIQNDTNYLSNDLKFEDQIVVDGTLCSSRYLKSGECIFDRSRIIPVVPKERNDNNSETNDQKQSECPLCRFMKNGSCKDEFIAWDICADKMLKDDDSRRCIKETLALFKCMSKDSYYDIMTSNSASKIQEMESMIRDQENSNK